MELGEDVGLDPDPDTLVMSLPYAQRQKLEIVRLLLTGAHTLLLDEPTSILSPSEAREVLMRVRRLADKGHTIVLVTHKLREAMEFMCKATVLRRGRVAGTIGAEHAREEFLAKLMFGKTPVQSVHRRAASHGPVVLRVESLCATNEWDHPTIDGVSFELHSGELLGIAGVGGNGQDHLVRLLAGLDQPVSGRTIWPREDEHSRRRVAHIPADRLGMGIVGSLSVRENLLLRSLDDPSLCAGPLLRMGSVRQWVENKISQYDIIPADPAAPAGSLSGGNIQRLILARELSGDPLVILAEEPTSGLDLEGVAQIRGLLLDRVRAGAAAVIASSDLDELLALCTSLLVMFRGGAMGPYPVPVDPAGQESLAAFAAVAMVGGELSDEEVRGARLTEEHRGSQRAHSTEAMA
jgi:simple sugar transport system ATP-binding protein